MTRFIGRLSPMADKNENEAKMFHVKHFRLAVTLMGI
jgi:hypothetical protein